MSWTHNKLLLKCICLFVFSLGSTIWSTCFGSVFLVFCTRLSLPLLSFIFAREALMVVGILFKDKWLTVALLLLLLYIKPRAGVSVFTMKPLQRHQPTLLCGMHPVNRWCHNWSRTLVLQVASSGNENRCGGLLTAARLFVPGARACVGAACWDMNCSLTSVGNASQSGRMRCSLVPRAEVDGNVPM